MTAAELASQLGAKRIGKNRWVAKCPAHGDRHPSLSIGIGEKFPVVLKCMSAGCTTKEILDSLGLKWADICGDRPMGSVELRELQQRRSEAELTQAFIRSLIRRRLADAARWYEKADLIAKRMLSTPEGRYGDSLAVEFHESLRKARRAEAKADEFDNPHCKGMGVPKCARRLHLSDIISTKPNRSMPPKNTTTRALASSAGR